MRLVSPVPIEQETLAFLAGSGLPVADLGANSTVRLFAARRGKVIDGVVGLELDGPHVLLRSLAVSAELRGSGLGVDLVGFAERAAAESGAVGLYLLTTTAADFFRRLDFVDLDRTQAPPAIAATQEFASLCPASSAFLYKRLGP
jgi:amino-acid N-acetyltransferase